MVYDFLIVGGGIIGISTAWQLKQRNPDANILLLEKESVLAAHQTGHNSGVIHSGIYYQPGSLKADFCRRGLEATVQFCRERKISYDQCGKILVATDEQEVARMQQLYQRSIDNNLDCQLISAEKLKELEPWINGLGAILVKATGIVDYREICRHMADEFVASGGKIELGCLVTKIEEKHSQVDIITGKGLRQAKFMICCAGLQADRLVEMHGIKT
ncbi:MAG: FAD-dependent oxidoreductase, partial [Gammaproteobacteria bacterium]|nr:FAD-dependent oxidoreductase [Gammaproteobacteria bacterium]